MDITNIREFLEYEEIFLFEDGDSIEQSEKYEIELKNVSYSYPNMDRPCIDHLNLKIKAEEKIAIVGLNGAGKTTLVKLICGFIEPDSGEILLNGKNIKEFNRREYYKIFSAVFQKHSILAASISANIAQSLTEIDLEKVEMCLEKSGLYEKVERLSEKCNTHIGKEVYDDAIDLSGGEMQKLLLARSLYKEASIFVLDEPTAALDPIAESEIYNKYNDLTWKKTAIFISHRLASTRFCDKIIFIEQGKIMEEGKHDELLEQRGKYYELFHIQSKYYQKGCEK
jgi:ATP-binding cassette subfamily B protein